MTDWHARREDPETSHISSESDQEHRHNICERLLDVMVRNLRSSFLYRRNPLDVETARRAAGLPDYLAAERAGFHWQDGTWKRCSDLRGRPNHPDPEKRGLMWTEWLYIDGVQEKVTNPHTSKPVGIAILTKLGIEAWLARF